MQTLGLVLTDASTTVQPAIDVSTVDFSVLTVTLVAIVGACLGVIVGIEAIKKGVNWLKSMIRKA